MDCVGVRLWFAGGGELLFSDVRAVGVFKERSRDGFFYAPMLLVLELLGGRHCRRPGA